MCETYLFNNITIYSDKFNEVAVLIAVIKAYLDL